LRSCLEDCLQRGRLGWGDLQRVYQIFLDLPFQDPLDDLVRWWDPWFPDDEDDEEDRPSGRTRRRKRRRKAPASCGAQRAFVAR
jgi:hypothetical protein